MRIRRPLNVVGGFSLYSYISGDVSALLSMLKRISAGLAAGAALSSFVALPAQADINTRSTVRWNSGGAVYTTKLKDFQKFLESDGEITRSTNRALKEGVALSGWTAEEIAKGLSKEYKVDVVYVARFLYSKKGVAFLENQTKSYFPYWGMKKTAVQALRSAIVLDSVDGELSAAGIMKMLPVDMRLADTCTTFDGAQNVCAKGKCTGDQQCTSLLSWYVFLPACVQANQIKDIVASRPVRGLW